MLSGTLEVEFRVTGETGFGEKLCVVGNCDELGNWQAQDAKILSLQSKEKDG